jgi:hypothetical protein
MKRYFFILIYSCLIMISGQLHAQSTCGCNCLKPLFDYLIASQRLFTPESDHIILASLMRDARNAGYDVSYTECAIMYKNINNYFYAVTTATSGTSYTARIGDCEVKIQATGSAVSFYQLQSNACTGTDVVSYHNTGSSTVSAQLSIGNCYTCTTVASGICYSAVTDTSVNAYTYGLAGNWRPSRAYAYYSDRTETQTDVAVALKSGGTIAGFAPFWKATGGQWKMQQNPAKWVWNSQTTLYNRKGLELETKDPLGRFNAGLYGYDDAMIVAAVQNAHYREVAFDGFEDYYYGGNVCDLSNCSVPRNFDFSAYKDKLDTTQRHTGKYSLRVDSAKIISISALVVQTDTAQMGLTFNTGTNLCIPGTTVLKSVRATQNALIPAFSPIAGKQILISAWVKEARDCKGSSYTGNRITIVVKTTTDSTTIIAVPQGAIIEGWQRYEQVLDLPATASRISLNLQSTGGTKVYFDDLRIHPFNANMKSFVYSPENLRLMAELDENNYATIYEYDDDGTLIRQKKETERGIKTISETRSALLKEPQQ